MKVNAIGIDLGTTDSCVAVFVNGKVEVIPNEFGSTTTPSVVAFANKERFVGGPAKNLISRLPSSSVFDAKRLIGRRFSDSQLQSLTKFWPFEVVASTNDGLKIRLDVDGTSKTFLAEEILAAVLSKMKQNAEEFLKSTVQNAVITVPACFNYEQRQAVCTAAKIAGLTVLRLMHEPSAIAIACDLYSNEKGQKIMLILDFGGGTCTASVILIENGIYEVRSLAMDASIGGRDFDNRLVSHFVAQIKRQHGKDISSNARALFRLQAACEQAKQVLSSSNQASIQLECLIDDIDFYSTITRARFNELCADLFRNILDLLEKALRDAKMDKSNIGEIILLGGSSRMPRIQQLLSEFFPGKQLNKKLHPEEAVAYGAAVQAACLSGEKSELLENMLLLDVAPLSLGIETSGEKMTPLIRRNTTIPTKTSHRFVINAQNQLCSAPRDSAAKKPRLSTTENVHIKQEIIVPKKSTKILIKVYEGERQLTKDNKLLGQFWLDRISQDAEIEITFDIDSNSTLNVYAKNISSGVLANLTVTNATDSVTKAEMDRMIAEARQYESQEKKQRERAAFRTQLQSYCSDIKDIIQEYSDDVLQEIDACIAWLNNNPAAEKQEYDNRRTNLKKLCDEMITKLNQLTFSLKK